MSLLRLSLLASILMSAGLLAGQAASAAAESYYRFPAIRGDAVVFTAEGDLWRTGAQGGQAQRLTTHPAAETNAAISYDGKWIAFSASYEGAQEAYVMPVAGGLPKRLTFENGAVTVLGCTAATMRCADGPFESWVLTSTSPCAVQPSTATAPFSNVSRFGRPPATGMT